MYIYIYIYIYIYVYIYIYIYICIYTKVSPPAARLLLVPANGINVAFGPIKFRGLWP